MLEGAAREGDTQFRPEDVQAEVSVISELFLVRSEADEDLLCNRDRPFDAGCDTAASLRAGCSFEHAEDSNPKLPSPVLTSAMLLSPPGDICLPRKLAGEQAKGMLASDRGDMLASHCGDILLSSKLAGELVDEVPRMELELRANVIGNDGSSAGEVTEGRSAETPELQAKSAKLNSLRRFSLSATAGNPQCFSLCVSGEPVLDSSIWDCRCEILTKESACCSGKLWAQGSATNFAVSFSASTQC